jgi:hypothetical protein
VSGCASFRGCALGRRCFARVAKQPAARPGTSARPDPAPPRAGGGGPAARPRQLRPRVQGALEQLAGGCQDRGPRRGRRPGRRGQGGAGGPARGARGAAQCLALAPQCAARARVRAWALRPARGTAGVARAQPRARRLRLPPWTESQRSHACDQKVSSTQAGFDGLPGGADVVVTYKICTVRAGSTGSSREGAEGSQRRGADYPPPDELECGPPRCGCPAVLQCLCPAFFGMTAVSGRSSGCSLGTCLFTCAV